MLSCHERLFLLACAFEGGGLCFFSWIQGALYVLLAKTTSWFGWLYRTVWYTCASTVAVPISYGWPFMQWLSENGLCVFESDYIAIILQFQNIGSLLYKSLKKDTYFRSKLFPELWNWHFFPPCVSQVAILVSKTSTSSHQKFFFRSAFMTQSKQASREFNSFHSTYCFVLLGEAADGSETLGRGGREVAREGRHAETVLKRLHCLGKKPLSFRLLDSCSFSTYILAYLQICQPACYSTPNLLIAVLIDF